MESILKKVEDSWKSAEFVVLPHRDSKDVFILGGIDEVQVRTRFLIGNFLRNIRNDPSRSMETRGEGYDVIPGFSEEEIVHFLF